MMDFSLGYDLDGKHYGLGVGLSKPPEKFAVRHHHDDGTYDEVDYVPDRTCRVVPKTILAKPPEQDDGKHKHVFTGTAASYDFSAYMRDEAYPRQVNVCSECGYEIGRWRPNRCPKCDARLVCDESQDETKECGSCQHFPGKSAGWMWCREKHLYVRDYTCACSLYEKREEASND